MRRVLPLLLLLPLHAAAGSVEEACARLADAEPQEVRRAVEDLRRAGPEAEGPLRALSESRAPEAPLAGAILAARRFDPELAVPDMEIFQLLSSPDAEARQVGVARAVGLGSTACGRMVSRWMDAASGDDLCRGLRGFISGPGRDPGWAKEALRHLRAPPVQVRELAAAALGHHAVRGYAADIRIAIEKESDRGVRIRLWAALLSATLSPLDLPALPREPEEAASVLSMFAGTYAPELRQVAWPRLTVSLPGTMERWLWDDPARLSRALGPEGALGLARRAGGRARYLTPQVRLLLGDDPDDSVRMTVAAIDGFAPQEVVRGAMFLSDPSESVRLTALRSFDRWARDRQPRPADRRIDDALRLAAALRSCLDSAAGAESPGETAWTVRLLLDAAADSGPAAGAAYHALWLVREAAMPAVAGLSGDADLGGAARRVARLLRLGVPPEAAQFPRGLDGAARVRQGLVTGLDAGTWDALASSDDAEERQLALGLIGDAWDRIDGREILEKRLVEIAGGQDAASAQSALGFLLAVRPESAPERQELDAREAWARPRRYLVERLRSSAAATGALDRQKAALIGMLGDRAAVLTALQGGKADDPAVFGSLLQKGGDAAFVPCLLAGFEEATDSSQGMAWFQALASSGPQGARVVAAFARDASRKSRVLATAVLLARAWCDSLTTPLIEQAARDDDARAVLVEALRIAVIRNRPPLRPRSAAALAAVLLVLAKDHASRPDLERIVATLGDGLRDADAATLEALSGNATILELARAARVPLERTGSAVDQIFLGDRLARGRALAQLPGNSLRTFAIGSLSALRCGNLTDFPEYYALEKSGRFADMALLAWAADEPESREELLRIRRYLRRWTGPMTGPGPSIRVVECGVPAEFDGPSVRARQSAAIRAGWGPTAAFMSLCTAAFRGARGDETALAAVLPRLGPDALPSLLPLLNAPDPGARASVARAIATLGPASPAFARAGLRASLQGENNRAARATKLAALQALGDPDGSEGLRLLAASADPDDRLAAARALDAARGWEALEALADLARDEDFGVREAADSTLVSLTGRELPPDTPPWEAADWHTWLRAHPEAAGAAR